MDSRWIWPFELLDKLGEGGMGVVTARYVGNNRQVAVKLLPDEIQLDTVVLARFERELDVLKQLRHPNIVHCFGGRCESKQRYYAMELVPGGTLADYLAERGRLAWENVVDFAIQMCGALQHAHEHGVIHRDVKPGNFLLTKAGTLKLSDFGLASVVAEGRLTAAGRTVGTILYMAPEQIRGGAVTQRTDLYALGCVIFEMVTGSTPFTGSSAAEVLQRHLKDPIPHAARNSGMPIELDELICDLLQKDPERRPASAAIVSERLNGILLPGRRKNFAEPELFQTLKPVAPAPIARLKNIRQTESESDLRRLPRERPSRTPWIVAMLMSLLAIQAWWGWSHAARGLRDAENVWVSLLDANDTPTRLLAARALAKFEHLDRSTIAKLSSTATSPILDLRLASLKTLTQHAAETRPVRAEIMRIQKVDDNPLVRDEANVALEAMQRSNSSFSLSSYSLWLVLLLVAGGLVVGGRRVWKKFQPLAE